MATATATHYVFEDHAPNLSSSSLLLGRRRRRRGRRASEQQRQAQQRHQQPSLAYGGSEWASDHSSSTLSYSSQSSSVSVETSGSTTTGESTDSRRPTTTFETLRNKKKNPKRIQQETQEWKELTSVLQHEGLDRSTLPPQESPPQQQWTGESSSSSSSLSSLSWIVSSSESELQSTGDWHSVVTPSDTSLTTSLSSGLQGTSFAGSSSSSAGYVVRWLCLCIPLLGSSHVCLFKCWCLVRIAVVKVPIKNKIRTDWYDLPLGCRPSADNRTTTTRTLNHSPIPCHASIRWHNQSKKTTQQHCSSSSSHHLKPSRSFPFRNGSTWPLKQPHIWIPMPNCNETRNSSNNNNS